MSKKKAKESAIPVLTPVPIIIPTVLPIAAQVNEQDIVIMLDKSGSMRAMGAEPLDAVNEFITEQKSLKSQGTHLTLWTFSGRHSIKLVVDYQSLSTVKTIEEYNPKGLTALYDVVGFAVKHQREKDPAKKAICLVMTDGEDTDSGTYNSRNISRIIKEQEKDGWKFIFMGTPDIIDAGVKAGFSDQRCAVFDQSVTGHLSTMAREVSNKVKVYRSTPQQEDLTINLTLGSHPGGKGR